MNPRHLAFAVLVGGAGPCSHDATKDTPSSKPTPEEVERVREGKPATPSEPNEGVDPWPEGQR